MFNKDNYHWTQDDYTKEGLEIMAKSLQKEGITLADEGSSIYLTQRMGKKHTRYEVTITMSKDDNVLSVTGYSGVSSEEDIHESPLKKPFIAAVKRMEEELVKERVEEKKKEEIIETKAINIPATEKKVKTETLKKTVHFTSPRDHINNILFQSNMIQACNGSVSLSQNPLTIKHTAITLTENIAEEKKETKDIVKVFAVEMDGKKFSVQMALQDRGQGTALKIESSSIPSNYSSKFVSYLENIILQPIQTSLRIPYRME
ncbi:hypothetical protein NEMIN01_1076 [Nematocida minor]|uniref:uncharacterized protein n=1 Tax=Nematocida minor TaxID=1912983 RepID=UPI002220D9FD|nr:uncharacterized protein NEMIN01_1076 [Nematocida minor]KAI5190538.1 hypothetical protein NEMIN01_1076 [Nematocida minor]